MAAMTSSENRDFLSWIFPVIEHPNQKVTSSTPARSTRIFIDFPWVIFLLIFGLMIFIWRFPQEKKTALHLAAEKGRLEVCKHLLELRADICALDNVSKNSMFELRAWKFKQIFDQSKQTLAVKWANQKARWISTAYAKGGKCLCGSISLV